jgi:hypothetical protein
VPGTTWDRIHRPLRATGLLKGGDRRVPDRVPDLQGIVEDWAASGNTVFIELQPAGTVG